MDRNSPGGAGGRGPSRVALRKESVDRNSMLPINVMSVSASLSARRAWIEIYKLRIHQKEEKVALRKESVDRNVFGFGAKLVHSVALRKESVDRNSPGGAGGRGPSSRSPQGERG